MKNISIFLIFWVLLMAGCGMSQKETEDKIIDLYQHGNYEEALKEIDRYLNKYNKTAFSYGTKGNILGSMNRLEEAIDCYEKALPYSNNKALAYENIASRYISLNKFDDAIKYYAYAIDADSRMYAANTLGISHAAMLKGDLVKALSSYQKAKESLDQSETAAREYRIQNKGGIYSRAALVAYQLDRKAESLEYARLVKELRGDDRAKLNFASFLVRLWHKEKAMIEFASILINNCTADDLSQYYLLVDDNANAEKYFNIDYSQQKTADQLRNWRLRFKRAALYPHADWKKARNQDWFIAKVQE